jgi:hypothetical protein
LIRIRKYKTFITATLLAVYAFIATPVQFWHHHSYEVNNVSDKSSKEKVEFNVLKSVQQSKDANCPICFHHYSVYNDVAKILFEISDLTLSSNKEYYIFSIPLSARLNFSNRGPPAVA